MDPILIYKGAEVCYDILNYMAGQLGESLKKLGCEVIYYDIEKDGLGGISQFVGKRFSAVLGIQTYAFDVFLPSRQCFLHDMIQGPKINYILDHPIWMKDHLEKGPKDYFVFTHDNNYIDFIARYYPAVSGAYLIPPGGNCALGDLDSKTKDIIFLGTYSNFRDVASYIKRLDRKVRILANKFLTAIRRNHNTPPEEVLRNLLAQNGIFPEESEFLGIFESVRAVISCAIAYYREKVIKSVLDAGICLTVYGDSWKNSVFSGDPNLIILPEVTPEDSLNEFASAGISLNIMAWHKDGFTERIANSMLNKSVVVSDKTTCLQEQYINGEELVLFDLNETDKLPLLIKDLLEDEKKRSAIAQRAYDRAIAEDTWLERAKLFIDYISEINATDN